MLTRRGLLTTGGLAVAGLVLPALARPRLVGVGGAGAVVEIRMRSDDEVIFELAICAVVDEIDT